MKRAFGIITKLDHCHTRDEHVDHLTKARRELINKGFQEDHIFAACSIINLLEPTSEQYKAIIRKIEHFDDLQYGFQQCKEALNRFIEQELPKTHFNQLIDFGWTKIYRYVLECQSNVKKLLPPEVNLTDEASFDNHFKQENDQKWDQIYQEKIFQPTFDKANIWQKTVLEQERATFIESTKTKFHDHFTSLTNEFVTRPVVIHQLMMKRYGYTVFHSPSQTIDDQLREALSFELEEFVLQTANMLARHLYDEYVCRLETVLNEISPEENEDLYRTQKLSHAICEYEIRAVILRICRPSITATLRFSHSDRRCRRSAVDELILIAPTVACHLCESSDHGAETVTTQITNWTPTLKKVLKLHWASMAKLVFKIKLQQPFFNLPSNESFDYFFLPSPSRHSSVNLLTGNHENE